MLIDKSIGAACTIIEYLTQLQRTCLQGLNTKLYKSFVLQAHQLTKVSETSLKLKHHTLKTSEAKEKLKIFANRELDSLSIDCSNYEYTHGITIGTIELIAKIKIKKFDLSCSGYQKCTRGHSTYISKLLNKSRWLKKLFIKYRFTLNPDQLDNDLINVLPETKIKELSLSMYGVNNASALFKILPHTKIKTLVLENFNLEDVDIEQLIHAIEKSKLKNIDLFLCKISRDATGALINLCRKYNEENRYIKLKVDPFNIEQLVQLIPITHGYLINTYSFKFSLNDKRIKEILHCLASNQNKITAIWLNVFRLGYKATKYLINYIPQLPKINEYHFNLTKLRAGKTLSIFDLLTTSLDYSKKVTIIYDKDEIEVLYKYIELLPKINLSEIEVHDYDNTALDKLAKVLPTIKKINSLKIQLKSDTNCDDLLKALQSSNVRRLQLDGNINLPYFSEVLPHCNIKELILNSVRDEFPKEEILDFVAALNSSTVRKFHGFMNILEINDKISPSIEYKDLLNDF